MKKKQLFRDQLSLVIQIKLGEISPDGKHITYIAFPHNECKIYFLQKMGINETKVITNDTHRGIRGIFLDI